ncbi:aminodeoxychorismate/anthranilate synthase component II [bacterium]|nr:aminodeoxychorismate/anthranilate synthase component II [bacterium]
MHGLVQKILILDNYDSFTYNLVQIVRELNLPHAIYRNDKIALSEVEVYSHIILSPGPGIPEEAGIMPALIKSYAATKHILGVCLGHQAIGEAFGAQLTNLRQVMHGKTTELTLLADDPIFKSLPRKFRVGRYHSWVVEQKDLPQCLTVTAVAEDRTIMALRHKDYSVCGLQFHPESVLTEHGQIMIKNWIEATSL